MSACQTQAASIDSTTAATMRSVEESEASDRRKKRRMTCCTSSSRVVLCWVFVIVLCLTGEAHASKTRLRRRTAMMGKRNPHRVNRNNNNRGGGTRNNSNNNNNNNMRGNNGRRPTNPTTGGGGGTRGDGGGTAVNTNQAGNRINANGRPSGFSSGRRPFDSPGNTNTGGTNVVGFQQQQQQVGPQSQLQVNPRPQPQIPSTPAQQQPDAPQQQQSLTLEQMVQQLIQTQKDETSGTDTQGDSSSSGGSVGGSNRFPGGFGTTKMLVDQVSNGGVQGAPAGRPLGVGGVNTVDTSAFGGSSDLSDVNTVESTDSGDTTTTKEEETTTDDSSTTAPTKSPATQPPKANALKPDICASTMDEARAICADKPSCDQALPGEDCYNKCSMLDQNACGEGMTCHPFVQGCLGAPVKPAFDDDLFGGGRV